MDKNWHLYQFVLIWNDIDIRKFIHVIDFRIFFIYQLPLILNGISVIAVINLITRSQRWRLTPTMWNLGGRKILKNRVGRLSEDGQETRSGWRKVFIRSAILVQTFGFESNSNEGCLVPEIPPSLLRRPKGTHRSRSAPKGGILNCQTGRPWRM